MNQLHIVIRNLHFLLKFILPIQHLHCLNGSRNGLATTNKNPVDVESKGIFTGSNMAIIRGRRGPTRSGFRRGNVIIEMRLRHGHGPCGFVGTARSHEVLRRDNDTGAAKEVCSSGLNTGDAAHPAPGGHIVVGSCHGERRQRFKTEN